MTYQHQYVSFHIYNPPLVLDMMLLYLITAILLFIYKRCLMHTHEILQEWFSLSLLWLCKMNICAYLLVQNFSFLNRFSKNTQTRNFLKICPVRAELCQADRRTEEHDEVVGSFPLFCECTLKKENNRQFVIHNRISTIQIWCDFDRASSFICGNKMQIRCNRGFHCRSYCLLNMFRAPLCPSSGAQEYYTVVAACGIWCCGFQIVGLVWGWRLCVRFAGCCSILQTGKLEKHGTKYHRHQPLYNILELLMMGIVVPETCWANNKICN